MDACSGLEAFCRGEEYGLLSVQKVRFVGGRCINISQGIRNMKEYESASFHGCYITLCPWLRFGRKIERLWAVKSQGRSRSAWCILRQKAVWVAPGNGDGRAEKPRYDVPQGVGVKNRYEAELTNQHRGLGSKHYRYSAIPHGGAEWWWYTAFCRLP